MKVNILHHRIDAVPVVVVISVVFLQTLAVIDRWPLYAAVIIMPFIRHVSLTEHNLAHLSIFRRYWLNECFGWLCFLSNGIPLEFYRIHHVGNHHRYNQRLDGPEEDWSSTFGFRGTRFPDRPIGKAYYVMTFPVITTSTCLVHLLRSPGSKSLQRFVLSVGFTSTVCVVLAWLNPIGFVAFFLVPWLIIFFAHGFNNYDQHSGCTMTDEFDSANESLTVFSKSFGFNIGYHIEHHLKPSLHWSKLPDYHRQIRELIPAERLAPRRRGGQTKGRPPFEESGVSDAPTPSPDGFGLESGGQAW